MKTQVDALTGIRGIAAWLVVLYHIRLSFAPSLPADLIAGLGKGYLAVDLFFVLSGFVLWMTWGNRFARDGHAAVSGFLRKRIARVWPLHIVVLLATVAFALAIQASGRPLPAHYIWHELPLHVLLVQNWGFTPDIAWNDPSWSISTELAAYLAFAALAPLLAGRIAKGAGVATPVAVAALSIVALDALFAARGHATLGDDIAGLGLWRCLAEFGCGVAMCIVWQRADGATLRIVTAGVATLALALWLTGLARETLAVPLAFAALVPLIASTSAWRPNPLSSRVAVWLGEISYSTYLAHFLLWTLFKLLLVRDASDVPLWLGAAFLTITLAVSVILYRLVELPARDRLGGAAPRPAQGNPHPA